MKGVQYVEKLLLGYFRQVRRKVNLNDQFLVELPSRPSCGLLWLVRKRDD